VNLNAPSGVAVAALRKALGLSRAQLAAIVMVDESWLAEFELLDAIAYSCRLSPFTPAFAMLSFAIRRSGNLEPWALKQWGNRMKISMERGGSVWGMRAFLEGP